MRYLKGFGRFWYDFLVGDDWKTTAGVVFALALGAVLTVGGWVGPVPLALTLAAGVAAAFVVALLIDVRSP